MNKSKSKHRSNVSDGDNEPYHHPILEEQMIIRFPADIAAKLSASMEDEEDGFKDFKIRFEDNKYAVIKLFGEELHAVLLSLPTIVETHRTVDGSHLFKSADIGEILIVHRPNAAPDGISEDFIFEHGLTPPTLNIVSKRKAKQEAARDSQLEGSSLDGIRYWEMVEIQLSALLSKEKTAKPICRQEFLEEPDVDPLTLEKMLRRNNRPEFKGYSGTIIDEQDIVVLSQDNEPVVHIPKEIIAEILPEEEKRNDEARLAEEETNETAQSSTDDQSADDTEKPGFLDKEDEKSSSSSYEEEEEEEEEEDEDHKRLKNSQDKIRIYMNNITSFQHQLSEIINEVMKDKIEKRIEDLKMKIQKEKLESERIKAEIAAKGS